MKQRRVTVQPRPQKQSSDPAPKPKAPAAAPAETEDTQAIQQAIAEASRLVELEQAASGTAEDRRELIHAAMNIYRAKQTSLEELDPQALARLRLLSETMVEAKKPKTH